MMTACTVSRLRGNWRPLFAAGFVLALVQNYWSYSARLASQSEWVEIERGNRSIAEQIAQRLDLACAVIGTNVQVRGYPVLLFHRGIHEGMTKEQWHKLPHAAGCARVWLEGIPAPRTNLPRFTEAFIEGPIDVHVLPH